MRRVWTVVAALTFGTGGLALAQAAGSLSGYVSDETGGVLAGAKVELRGPRGVAGRATSDASGRYRVSGLAPGRYSMTVTKPRFLPQQRPDVTIAAATDQTLDVSLALAPLEERVTVEEDSGVSTDPEAAAGAIVLKGKDLESLPEDPDEMADALQALAGPAAGPNGAQIFIDGFSGGRLPPRAAIREIRINSNPFSAQFDQMGYGRIEILTRPGSESWRGEASLHFNDESLNARDPFAVNRPAYQRRQWELELSGPLSKQGASFAFDVERRDVDENALINARLLNRDLSVVSQSEAVVTPQRRTQVTPRLDLQLGKRSTLSLRYSYNETRRPMEGIGGYSLPSRAYEADQATHTLQLTHTLTLKPTVVNETRIQVLRDRNDSSGDASLPTLEVRDAFTGGGAQVGQSYSIAKRIEIQNYTSWTRGQHALRAGVRLRGAGLEDVSRRNFGGTVYFDGGLGPELDATGQPVRDAAGALVMVPLTSLERYRRTLIFQSQGLAPAAVREGGGGPSQFQIVGGEPLARTTRWDIAPFVQDDWRVTPALTLSAGLRYENQTNIRSRFNLAPRLAFAWAPGVKSANDRAKTVLRGGFGIFYSRFSEGLTLEADRFDGVSQRQYLVTDEAVLGLMQFSSDGVSGVPSVATLGDYALPQTVRRIDPDLQAPYDMQSVVSLERQLPQGFSFSSVFVSTLSRRVLRSRNVNARLPDGSYPLGSPETVYRYESTGRINQQQLILGLQSRPGRGQSLFVRYFLTYARGDADGPGSFPSDPYDLAADWGRAGADVRHRVNLGGSLLLPAGVRVSPMVMISSGRPFNITTGWDNNGDTLKTDRPAYATDPNKPGVVTTKYGLLDPNPDPGQARIPRNLGTGPGMVMVNLRVGKVIGLGPKRADDEAAQPGGGAPPTGGPGFGGGPGGHGHGGGGGHGGGHGPGHGPGDATGRKYSLSFSVSAQNILNHVNRSAPVGNLTSASFGQSLSAAGAFGRGGGSGARRVELQARLSF